MNADKSSGNNLEPTMQNVGVGGGSLLIAWQLKDKTVLIVGGGEVASQRIDSLLVTDAKLVVVCPSEGLNPRSKRLIGEYQHITHIPREFDANLGDLDGKDMVLTALDDVEVSREIVRLCRTAKIPVNAADIPDSCDFYFGSQIRDGPLQIMISTNGNGPKMANLVKKKLQGALSGAEGRTITNVGELRAQLKVRAPGVGGELGKRRMKWMSAVCNAWSFEELAQLDEVTIQRLLDEGWEKGTVPTFNDLTGRKGFSQARQVVPPLSSVLAFAAGATCTLAIILARRK